MMKRYAEYKESGVEWLGEIPIHWDVTKLKFIGDAFIGITYSPEDVVENDKLGNLVLRSSNIQEGKLSLDDCIYVKKEISEKGITKEGDILICSRNGSRALIGKNICIDKSIAGASFGAFMTVFRTDFFKFIYHYMNSQIFIGQSSLFLTSTINQLTITTLNSFQTALPPRDEQISIASYLDQKTSQIDSLIAKKKQMIELLKEERAAIINHAVTKGINPDAEMKDSGVEWLGEVPKHWVIKKVKQLTSKIGSGVTPKGGAEVYQTSGIPLLRSQNIHFSGLQIDDVAYITKEIHESMSNSEVLENDVLLNITGASIGRCFYADKSIIPANVNQHVCILRPNDNVEKKYLCLLLSSKWGQFQIDYCQNGANREGLNFEQLKNFRFPMPPKSERLDIFSRIDRKTSQIDSSINYIEKEISLIEEYRTALINETVTGKIDIRDKVNV